MKNLSVAACAVTLLCTALPAVAQAQEVKAGVTKATPPAFPVFPFYANLALTNGAPVSSGFAARTLGVTNLTFTNFNTTAAKVFVFLPVFSPGETCGGTILGGSPPGGYFMVPAEQTVSIPYPTPQVYKGKPSCIAANIVSGAASGVEMYVTGFGE